MLVCAFVVLTYVLGPSQLDGPFEYPQHTFWLRNKEINFQSRSPAYTLCKGIKSSGMIKVQISKFYLRKILIIFLPINWVHKRSVSLRQFF